MMRMKNIAILLCILLSASLAKADDDKVFVATQNLMVGLEVGADVMLGELKGHPRIREKYSPSTGFGELSSMGATYVGLKAEYFFVDNRVGVAIGARITKFETDYSRHVYDGAFLWRLREDGTTTDFVHLASLSQISRSVGVPMEVRWFPNARELPVQIYFKAGVVVDWCFSTKNDVQFYDLSMYRYADEVSQNIGEHAALSALIFLGFGLKIGGFKVGRYKFPWINLELHVLDASLTRQAFEFIKPYYGAGLQASIQIPIGANVPIGSN
jgi:hypothetical protein